nr:PREDICTED: uncharacterized protein LOC108220099 [Daucus carota subsp. sativus]
MIQDKTYITHQLLNSTALMSPLLLLIGFALLSITIAQDQSRSPHGLTYSSPEAFSPAAFEFFHPNNHQHPSIENPCAASGCPPLHLSATVQSSLAYDSRFTPDHYSRGRRLTAAGIAGIIFGFVCVVILAMGIYYVMTKRQANMSKSNTAQAEA